LRGVVVGGGWIGGILIAPVGYVNMR